MVLPNRWLHSCLQFTASCCAGVDSPFESRGCTDDQAGHAAAHDSGQDSFQPCRSLIRSPCHAQLRAASPRRALQDVKAKLRRFANRRSTGLGDPAAVDTSQLTAYLHEEDHSCDKVLLDQLTSTFNLPHACM